MESRAMILWWMQKEKGELVSHDEDFCYFNVRIDGFRLMYRKKRFKPDGRKGFMLTDALAKCLGFRSLYNMEYCLTGIQYWRKFTSIERLQIAFQRYDDRQEMYRQMAKNIMI